MNSKIFDIYIIITSNEKLEYNYCNHRAIMTHFFWNIAKKIMTPPLNIAIKIMSPLIIVNNCHIFIIIHIYVNIMYITIVIN